VAEAVRAAAGSATPIYPVGGGTGLDYGLPVTRPGLRLSLAKLNRLVDYPHRDLTITVEAGMTAADLARHLAANRQRLPVEVPQADRATLGGAVAVNASGPRRYGCGTLRDCLLGISAVDGRGTVFSAGGRVVKNAAGYDLCKLLIGSCGTLGVIAQLTLMVRPMPETSALLAGDVADLATTERCLAGLAGSKLLPVAIEVLAGPAWNDDPLLAPRRKTAAGRLVVALEGTRTEVEWMIGQLAAQWSREGIAAPDVVRDQAAAPHWQRLTEFAVAPGHSNGAPTLTVKICVQPSATLNTIRELFWLQPGVSLQSHAGNGVIWARLPLTQPREWRALLDGRLRGPVAAVGGSLTVVSYPAGLDLTARDVWGPPGGAAPLMRIVKQQFDPQGLLNPGRFFLENS